MACQRDLVEAMEDEALVDVVLVGTDNLEIPCTKFVLATRSPVFKKMFFAGFQDKERAPLDYPSVVLRVLVKYCYSDEIDLDLILKNDECLTDQEAIALIQIRDAARYFELFAVANNIENQIGESVFHLKDTRCVCAILSELMHRIDDEGPFWDMFLQLVIHKPDECLLPKGPSEANQGAMACDPRLLAKLLDLVTDKDVVVRCLQKWFEDASSIDDESNANLLEVSKRVDLKELSPLQLSAIKPSPLFPIARIYEAFVHHGKQAKAPKPQSLNNVIYVSGSGVKGLDGYYYRPSSTCPSVPNMYQKEGKYAEMACHFELKWLPVDRKWIISMKTKDKNSVPLNMYEAYPTEDTETTQPPFKFWKCVEGAEPAPLVTMIDTPSPLPKHLPKPPSPARSPQAPTQSAGFRTFRPNAFSFGSISQPIEPTRPDGFSFGSVTQPIRVDGSPSQPGQGDGSRRRAVRARRPFNAA
ncbi:unnamed protein product [Cylindrotheca closterium]|uniref:BTB domain-containing protein n=1 Tax=Cylindrotheca closterium TaxID=2856 RepID=A0AAD2JML4_9STRA|nr:unnamed protein product [Cylindrotheca closterium]